MTNRVKHCILPQGCLNMVHEIIDVGGRLDMCRAGVEPCEEPAIVRLTDDRADGLGRLGDGALEAIACGALMTRKHLSQRLEEEGELLRRDLRLLQLHCGGRRVFADQLR